MNQNKTKIATQTFVFIIHMWHISLRLELQTHTKLTLAASIDVSAMKHHRHMFVSIQTVIPIQSIHVRYLRRRERHSFRANTNVRHARVSVSHRAVVAVAHIRC